MPPNTANHQREPGPDRQSRRVARSTVLAATLLFVAGALLVSSALVIYTGWKHDLKNGAFALIFAVLSAQIALNWFRWKGEEDDREEDHGSLR